MSIFSLGFLGAFAVAGITTMTDAWQKGDVDEASRQGVLAGPAVVEDALKSHARASQLAAIAAAPGVEARAELLPALADVASRPDRRVAIPAAQAARTIARELAMNDRPDDIGDDDIATWRALFDQIAHNQGRAIEVRVLALDTVTALAQSVTTDSLGFDLVGALADPDPAYRAAAVSLVPRPTPAKLRTALGNAVQNDANDYVALVAAQALCGDGKDVALAPLGARGLERVKRLVKEAPPQLTRDAKHCLE
jgi:hypothetical protein